jgi:hypothetical protein
MQPEPEDEDLDFQRLLDGQTGATPPSPPQPAAFVPAKNKMDWRIKLTVAIGLLSLATIGVLSYIILNPPGAPLPEVTTSP